MSAPPAKRARLNHAVYEIQIDVDASSASDFETWLRSNPSVLFDLPKVELATTEVFALEHDARPSQASKSFVVQYSVADHSGLHERLKHDAPPLPDDAAARFKDKLKFTKRLLRTPSTHSGGLLNGRRVITFVTGSKKKLEEVIAILGEGVTLPCDITNAKLDLPELQGEPEEVAAAKVKLAAEEVGGPALTEDTSLCFNALHGLPGVYVKWFMEKLGNDGLNNILTTYPDKTAYAQCIFAYCAGPGCEPITFVGRVAGKIVPARGSMGFGWDPVFEPEESGGKTFAEMTQAEKNAISHRGRALAKVKEYFIKEGSLDN
jgi:inosine triphosphate pyrophosphatase